MLISPLGTSAPGKCCSLTCSLILTEDINSSLLLPVILPCCMPDLSWLFEISLLFLPTNSTCGRTYYATCMYDIMYDNCTMLHPTVWATWKRTWGANVEVFFMCGMCWGPACVTLLIPDETLLALWVGSPVSLGLCCSGWRLVSKQCCSVHKMLGLNCWTTCKSKPSLHLWHG